jgi:hypothetical protein
MTGRRKPPRLRLVRIDGRSPLVPRRKRATNVVGLYSALLRGESGRRGTPQRTSQRRSNDVRDAKANARTDNHRCGQAPPWPGRLGTDLRGVPRPHCGRSSSKSFARRLSATCTRLPNYGAIYGSASGPPTSDPGPRDVVFTIEGSAKTPPFGGGPRQCPFKRPFSGRTSSGVSLR